MYNAQTEARGRIKRKPGEEKEGDKKERASEFLTRAREERAAAAAADAERAAAPRGNRFVQSRV